MVVDIMLVVMLLIVACYLIKIDAKFRKVQGFDKCLQDYNDMVQQSNVLLGAINQAYKKYDEIVIEYDKVASDINRLRDMAHDIKVHKSSTIDILRGLK